MKYTIFILSVLLLLTFTACGEKEPVDAATTTTVATTVRTTAPVPTVGWITADSLRVRAGAGLTYEVIGGITGGEQVQILSRTGDWYEIRFGEGTAFVSGQYLTFTPPTADTTVPTILENTTTAQIQ